MYSVFLVDDEPIVLDGIRSRINWEEAGFSFAGEATDGELALSMIHELKPDILITDIKMPFMDGLELSAAIKKTQPWIKIIILSGHDEFDYAKKAISIGVEDYLLKPFTSEDVIASLKKIATQIDRERTQLSDISRMKEELKSHEKLVQKEFLNNLVHGSADMNNLMAKCQELKIDLLARYYKIFISRIESRRHNMKNQEEACSRLNSYSAAWDQTYSFLHHGNRLVCICKGTSQNELEERVFHLAETIEHIATQNDDCYVITGIGKTVDHLSLIPASYEDAKKITDAPEIESQIQNPQNAQNRIISSDDISFTGENSLLELKDNDPIVDRLKYASKNDISAIIEESMTLIHDNQSQFNVFASYLLVDMIFAVSKLVENLGGDIKEINPDILQRQFLDKAVRDEANFVKTLEDILNFTLEFRDSRMTGKYGDTILKAKKYIEENYADQNTTLTTVADAVAMSPNHFSTIFSHECKTTFIEYLTNVRIENAKRLMKETDMKGYDIAYECGFSDPHYFSYIFKKNTGLSPREYKLSFEK